MIANVRGALFYHVTLSLYYCGGGGQQAYSRNYANAEWKKSDVGRVEAMTRRDFGEINMNQEPGRHFLSVWIDNWTPIVSLGSRVSILYRPSIDQMFMYALYYYYF